MIPVLGLEDVALLRELVKRFAEALGTDPAGLPEIRKRQRLVGLLQGAEKLFCGRSGFWGFSKGRSVEHLEGDLIAVAVQRQGNVRVGGRGAMLDGEGKLVPGATS